MNNDIEELLASLRRPAPSPDLDRRIAELCRPVVTAFPVNTRWRRRLQTTATAASFTIVGFLLGRQSAPTIAASNSNSPKTSTTDTESPAISEATPRELAAVTVHIPINAAVSNFLNPAKPHTPLFGRPAQELNTEIAPSTESSHVE